MRRLVDRLAAAAAMLVVVGCVSSRPPVPIRPQELGATFAPAVRSSAGTALFSECDGNPAAPAAQVVVAGWFDVVSHIDACDLGSARYYAGRETEERIAARLAALAEGAEPACRAQARTVLARVRATNRHIAAWIPHAVPVCSLDVQRDAYRNERDRMTARTAEMRCEIRRSFPELPGGRC